VKKLVWKVLRALHIAAWIQLNYKGILDELGWTKSFYKMQSIDRNGNPIPWCTYSFINFIGERLNLNQNIFEFGSGNSTLWYAKKVKSILAVEHDNEWIKQIRPKLPENAKILFKELDSNGEYAKAASNSGENYDIIIIDGRDRNNCVYQSIKVLNEAGVIVFDNSQIAEYAESLQFLKNEGFKRIDFKGLCPTVAHINTTSIFYRTLNCLNI
jgi:hypothetical protein